MKSRYKVVKRNRYSAIINGNSKYALRYLPGTIVKALPYTMGIMVFKYKAYAEEWCNFLNVNRFRYWDYKEPYMIIEVEPLVRGVKRTFVHSGTDSWGLDNYYRDIADGDYRLQEAPDNTYSHMKVRVLT